jgi:hypothetical protein
MKLITKAIQNKLDKAGYYGQNAICKFFNPCGAATWIIFGQDEEQKDVLFCVADIGRGCVEAGTVLLSDLENFQGRFGLGIERDMHFEGGQPMSDFLGKETLGGC